MSPSEFRKAALEVLGEERVQEITEQQSTRLLVMETSQTEQQQRELDTPLPTAVSDVESPPNPDSSPAEVHDVVGDTVDDAETDNELLDQELSP